MFDELRELYQEVILDHGRHPRNFRHPPEASHEAKGDNPMCGDKLIVYLTVGSDPERTISDVAFLGKGCAISTASASLMTELLRGKTERDARTLFAHFHDMCLGEEGAANHGPVDDDALDRLKVLSGVRQYPVRVKCATLPWHTMIAALAGTTEVTTE